MRGTGDALVLGQVAPERLVDVCAPEDEQAALPAADERQQLSKHVAHDHPQPGLACVSDRKRQKGVSASEATQRVRSWAAAHLDVLEREVLGLRAPVKLVLRLDAGDEPKEVADGRDERVHVHVDVVAATAAARVGQWPGVDR